MIRLTHISKTRRGLNTVIITRDHIADLQDLLQRRHSELSAQLDRELHVESSDQLAVSVPSDADRVTASQDTDDLAARAQRDSVELHAVATALASIEHGTYGSCRDCGVPIDYPRLLAHPTALRCLGCQESFEAAANRSNVRT